MAVAEPPGSQGASGRKGVASAGGEQNRATGSEVRRGKHHGTYLGFIPSFLSLKLGICQFSELSCEMIAAQRQITNIKFSLSSDNPSLSHTQTPLPAHDMCTNFEGNT